MSEDVQSTATAEAGMRDQLARGDAAIADVRPVLRYLMHNRNQAMFSDEVRARVFGMLQHVARQFLLVGVKGVGRPGLNAKSEGNEAVEAQSRILANMLGEDPAVLAHAHTLALETQMVERLRYRTGFDGVVSPLIEKLAASSDREQARLAMRVLAAQARFLHQQRRMELPLGELPGDLFDKALRLMRGNTENGENAEAAEMALRKASVDQDSRLALIEQLLRSMGRDAMAALAIDHAGLPTFLSALAMGSGLDRSLVIYSCGEDQLVRLALSLRAAGLEPMQIRGQFLYLHPDVEVPEGIGSISPAVASAILAEPAAELVG